VNTNIVVKSKESAVVGGVVVNRSATDFDRNPPGGIQNVEGGQALFSFIKSKSYVSNRSQFVIFVTPEILESASQGTEEIKKKFRQRNR
jgi:pilus assembly protein CpaC